MHVHLEHLSAKFKLSNETDFLTVTTAHENNIK